MATKLSSMYTKRWLNAVRVFTEIKAQAEAQDCMIWYEGEIQPSQIVITDKNIVIKDGSIWHMLFENDTNMDEGMHTSIEDYNKWVRQNFKLIKFIELKI